MNSNRKEPGVTYRPSPEMRRVMEEIHELTGIPMNRQMDAAMWNWLNSETDAILQLYRLKREASNG